MTSSIKYKSLLKVLGQRRIPKFIRMIGMILEIYHPNPIHTLWKSRQILRLNKSKVLGFETLLCIYFPVHFPVNHLF